MQEEISASIKWSLLFIATMGVMSGVTVVSSLPLLSQTFAHIPHIDFLSKLMLTIPSIVIALFAPVAGIFVDKIGRLKPLFMGLGLFVIGGSSGFYLHDFYAILIGRAVLGVGVALVMTSSTALIGDYFSEGARHKFMSTQGMAVGFGGIIFIISGGFLAQLHWSYPFAIYLIPLLFLPLMVYALYEPKTHQTTVGEITAVEPKLLPVYATAFFAMVLFYMMPTQLPYLVIDELGGTPSSIGLVIGCAMFVNALTSMRYASIKGRLSYRAIFMVTFLFFGLGLLIISQVQSVAQLYFSTVFMGIGFGLLLVNINAWFLSLVPPRKRGKASGMLASSFFLGQFASPLLFEPIVQAIGIQGLFLAVALLSFGVFGVLAVRRT